MTDPDIVVQLPLFSPTTLGPQTPGKYVDLHTRWLYRHELSPLITDCPPAMRLLDLLGPLHWDRLPERDLYRDWGKPTIPNAALILAELIKLTEGLPSFGHLYRYLGEHPALIALLGLPLLPAPQSPAGFNSRASLPTERHFTRMLRRLPNGVLQFLLADSVQLISTELAARGIVWGECICLDTKHVIAWVQENNPKAYVADRYNKANQPRGDPDCRLGCKRRANQAPRVPTPTHNPVAASRHGVGEYYWAMALASSSLRSLAMASL